MADPVSMAAISGGANVLGGVVGTMGTVAAENYNRKFAEGNQRLALQQAAEEAARVRRAGARRIGTMQAGFGAGNIAMSGSAAAVLVDQARETELEARTALYQGALEARKWESEAKMAKMRRTSAIIGGVLGVGADLLSAGSSVQNAKGV
jgi:membrane protein YqaA with SNARE-associated domain